MKKYIYILREEYCTAIGTIENYPTAYSTEEKAIEAKDKLRIRKYDSIYIEKIEIIE